MANRITEADKRPTAPFEGSVTIVTTDIAPAVGSQIFQGIYVGGAGDVKVRMLDGSTPTFKAVPVGTILPIQCDQVFTTGGSASLMVGFVRNN